MSARPRSHNARSSSDEPPAESPASESLVPDTLAEPDDQGLSLEDLGQAYAALLQQGADPYAEPAAEEASVPEEPAEDESPPPASDHACELSPRSILEAMLFVGHPQNEPLTSRQIAGLMRGVRAEEIDDLVRELREQYAREGAPYTIDSAGEGYLLALRPEFGPLREAFYGRIKEARLSQAAIDILAIVAYNQPASGERVDQLRGQPSGGVLRQLVRRDLLSVERAAGPPRQLLFRTTPRFLRLFGLDSLADLPQSQELDRA